jgi:branched-chain amino acid transport system permease protein
MLGEHIQYRLTMVDIGSLTQAVITGLLQGGVYALISLGLTIIFGVMGIINFAQADFMMLGMYTTFFAFASFALSPLLMVFLLLPAFFVVGAAAQKFLINPILDDSPENQLILTFGLVLILQNGAQILWSPDIRTIDVEYAYSAISIGSFTINEAKLIAFVFAMGLGLVTFYLLRYTEFGNAMRATASNDTIAKYAGIDVNRIYLAAFGIGIALTASAGALLHMYQPVSPYVGFDFVIVMFVVVVLGGLGSVRGAILAGLLVGVVEQVATLVVPLQLQPSIIFVLFLLVILVKPYGIFGSQHTAGADV